MINTADKCRAEEARHRKIAREATLPNVRKIALAAADAWHRHSQDAENHESGQKSPLSDEDAAIALEFLLEDEPAPTNRGPDGWDEVSPFVSHRQQGH